MVNEGILKAPEQKEYPIENFYLETRGGERLALQNVSSLDLGIIYEPRPFGEAERKIRIFSPRGNMEFFLSEIREISFSINNEKDRVFIRALSIVDKEEIEGEEED